MQKYYLSLLISCLFVSVNAQYTWVNKSQFPDSGRSGAACFTINGKGYLIGGQLSSSPTDLSAQTWQYSPSTDSWIQKAGYPHGTGGGTFFQLTAKDVKLEELIRQVHIIMITINMIL